MKAITVLLLASVASFAVEVKIQSDGVLEIDGKPAFPIGFTVFPAITAKALSGENAYQQLAGNGIVFNRCGTAGKWDARAEAALDVMLAHAGETGVLCAIYIPDLTAIAPGDKAKEQELRRVVLKYRNNRAVAFWKAADEPEWGRKFRRRICALITKLSTNSIRGIQSGSLRRRGAPSKT